jgi:hypothetical protein
MKRPIHQPLDGSVWVTPGGQVVYTLDIHCAEYLAELIESDCAKHPAEQAWHGGAALRGAVEIIRARCGKPEWEALNG